MPQEKAEKGGVGVADGVDVSDEPEELVSPKLADTSRWDGVYAEGVRAALAAVKSNASTACASSPLSERKRT